MRLPLVFISSLFILSSAFAQSVSVNVELQPAGSFQAASDKVKGEAKKLPDGSIEAKKLTVSVQSLKTGIDLRDEHFWKHLNSEKYPKVTISDVKGKNGKATGQLEVAGVKKPITIAYTEAAKMINAKFTVDTGDYKLPAAEYMGVGVDKKVSGEAKIPLL